MEDNDFQFPTPACSNYVADVAKISTIVEEGPRICPLCSSMVRLYYIGYTEKIFMCVNMACLYPFGDNYTIYSSDDDGYFLNDPELSKMTRKRATRSARSIKSTRSVGQSSRRTSTVETSSELSASEWSEINRLNQAYDSDDSMTSSKIFTRKSSECQMKKRAKMQENEEKIKQNVEKIKELNKVLFEGQEEFDTIQNEKWIKNLSAMQSSSGMKLVKDQELQKLRNSQNNICHGELKIDIESNEDAMSSIKIEIGNVTQVFKKP